MKKLILILLFSSAFVKSPAQHFCSVQLLNSSCDTLKLEVCTWFPFGSPPSTCPPFSGYVASVTGSQLTLDIYYNISGAWPAFFCTRTDTIIYTIPQGVLTVQLTGNQIADQDTLTGFDDTTMVLCLTVVEEIDHSGILLSPNPATGDLNIKSREDIQQVEIIDITGKTVLTINNESSINVAELPQGIYFIQVWIKEQSYKRKFVKQ